jgi:hypothetical protein
MVASDSGADMPHVLPCSEGTSRDAAHAATTATPATSHPTASLPLTIDATMPAATATRT